jgi:hypothetical protein
VSLQYTDGQQQDVATASSGIAAGAGDHLPVGDYGGLDYRSAMRFALPPWGAWTNIVSAYLKFYISDHKHVAPKNSSIYCSRMNVPVWTKDQGTQDCENGFSGSNNTQYGDIGSTSTDRISFSSGSTANAAKTLDVTAMVKYYKNNNSPLVFVFDNNDVRRGPDHQLRRHGPAAGQPRSDCADADRSQRHGDAVRDAAHLPLDAQRPGG